MISFLFIIYHLHGHRKPHKFAHDESKKPTPKEPEMFITNDQHCHVNFSSANDMGNVFQPINSNDKLVKGYVFSAYFDDRFTKQIVIISILEGENYDLQCIVWFSLNSSTLIKANVKSIPEGSDRRYTASYIICPIASSRTPIYVSIIRTVCTSIDNIIPIKPIGKSPSNRTFSVCVTPLNLNYNNANQLIEMLSINQLMGVSHIYFYNYSTGNATDKIFHEFSRRRFVTVVPWNLPMKVHIWPIPDGYVEEVKYFGQMAMLNDCLYRNMGRYKYVAFADLDEYLIPRRHRNWHELLDSIEFPASTKAWMFRNTFFKTEWPSAPDMANNRTIAALHAMSLLKVRRETTISPPYQRSKMIVDPLAVNIIGVHNVWEFCDKGPSSTEAFSTSVLSVEDGVCHHYRFWDGMGEATFVEDRNIFRLRDDLVGALQKNRKLF